MKKANNTERLAMLSNFLNLKTIAMGVAIGVLAITHSWCYLHGKSVAEGESAKIILMSTETALTEAQAKANGEAFARQKLSEQLAKQKESLSAIVRKGRQDAQKYRVSCPPEPDHLRLLKDAVKTGNDNS